MTMLRPAMCLAALLPAALGALAQDPAHRLKPLDRSSPRAALQSFLTVGISSHSLRPLCGSTKP